MAKSQQNNRNKHKQTNKPSPKIRTKIQVPYHTVLKTTLTKFFLQIKHFFLYFRACLTTGIKNQTNYKEYRIYIEHIYSLCLYIFFMLIYIFNIYFLIPTTLIAMLSHLDCKLLFELIILEKYRAINRLCPTCVVSFH